MEFPLPFGRMMTSQEEYVHTLDEGTGGWGMGLRFCRLGRGRGGCCMLLRVSWLERGRVGGAWGALLFGGVLAREGTGGVGVCKTCACVDGVVDIYTGA